MAKRARDFETASRLPNTRRGHLAVLQVHALEHYERACPGEGHFAPNPPRRRYLACPICGLVWGLNEFNEEHAPQDAGQSALGERACVVLTCEQCNKRSGDGFERRAGLIARNALTPNTEVVYVRRDLATGLLRRGAVVDQAQVATDLKSAFVIAFAALGYTFAFAPALRPIRQAIHDGTAPPEGWGGPIDQADTAFEPFTVNECETGAVVVMGGERGWMLPAGPTNTLDQLEVTNRARALAWPKAVEIGTWKQFEELTKLGHLFHADVCPRPDHRIHGPRQPRHRWPIEIRSCTSPTVPTGSG